MKNLQELLDFQPVEGNAPVMTCNGCGKKAVVKHMAVLHPFENESSDYSVATCSDQCRDTLLNTEYKDAVTMMMAEAVCNISMNMNEKVNNEWHGYFQQLQ